MRKRGRACGMQRPPATKSGCRGVAEGWLQASWKNARLAQVGGARLGEEAGRETKSPGNSPCFRFWRGQAEGGPAQGDQDQQCVVGRLRARRHAHLTGLS